MELITIPKYRLLELQSELKLYKELCEQYGNKNRQLKGRILILMEKKRKALKWKNLNYTRSKRLEWTKLTL